MILRRRIVIVLVPFAALGLAAWAGCGDSENNGTERNDGGTESGSDSDRPDTGAGDAGATDAPVDAPLDVRPDGPPSTPGQLTCGTVSNCDAGEAICCIEFLDAGATTQCIPDTQACSGNQLPFDCDQRLDCGDAGAGSNQCCLDIGDVSDPELGGATCAASCPATTSVPLCKRTAECAPGTECNFFSCKGYRIGICGALPAGLCTPN